MTQFEEIKKELEHTLSASRFLHTLGVVETAEQLAVIYGVDRTKVRLAALLHDAGKPFASNLEHAGKSVQIAKERFGITDSEILDAILYHTTGRPNMSKLEKIIFVADYIEPNRKKAPNLEILRQMACENLDQCVGMIAKATLDYLIDTKVAFIDPLTEQTYHFYKER